MERNSLSKQRLSTVKLVQVSIIGAIAFLVMYFEFPLFAFFPPFLKVDLSDVIIFAGGVVLGPIYVILAEVIKELLHLLMKSSTGGIGELSNFIAGVSLVFPAVYFYKRNDLKRLLMGLGIGIVSVTVIMCLANYFIFLPLYGYNAADSLRDVVLVFGPFNLVRGVIISIAIVIFDRALSNYYDYLK